MVKKTETVKLKAMKFKEVERIIKKDGWILIRTDGSHYQYKHPDKKGNVTIPRHSVDLHKNIVCSILAQAGLLHLIR